MAVLRQPTISLGVAMPAQGQKSWDVMCGDRLVADGVAMPAQGQKSWDCLGQGLQCGRNACPGAEILGRVYIVVSQCLPRGRNPGTPSSVFCMVPIPIRNACPGAEILGLDEIHGLLVFGARRNACPGAEILGPVADDVGREDAHGRNACPGAEILGRGLVLRFLGGQCGRNVCPGTEILGRSYPKEV